MRIIDADLAKKIAKENIKNLYHLVSAYAVIDTTPTITPPNEPLTAGGRGEHMTNADRIRAMGDEELLDFMKKSVANAYMCKIMRTEPMFLTLEWLQQPAKEDT